MLGSRSREKHPLGTAFPTTHITYKCTWPEPALLGLLGRAQSTRGTGHLQPHLISAWHLPETCGSHQGSPYPRWGWA